MPKARRAAAVDHMRPEYDFANAVRGKYYRRYTASSNVVVLDKDVSSVFPNAAAVNEALRALASVARARVPVARRTSGSPRQPKKSHRQ
jgi:hypothetical protein